MARLALFLWPLCVDVVAVVFALVAVEASSIIQKNRGGGENAPRKEEKKSQPLIKRLASRCNEIQAVS